RRYALACAKRARKSRGKFVNHAEATIRNAAELSQPQNVPEDSRGTVTIACYNSGANLNPTNEDGQARVHHLDRRLAEEQVDILLLQETRMPQDGQPRLQNKKWFGAQGNRDEGIGGV